MTKDKYQTLSMKLTGDITLESIDKRATELNLKRSEFVNLAIEMLLKFDLGFWRKVKKFSERLHIPEWAVIQNMLIDRFARDEAYLIVYGEPKSRLDDFIFLNTLEGPTLLTGSEFEKVKLDSYILTFEGELFKKARAKRKAGKTLTEREKIIFEKYESQKGFEDEYDEDEYVTAEELEEWEKEAQEKWEKEHK